MNANSHSTPKTNGNALSELSFSEAPASWNTRYIDPNGFECQITLRGESGAELLERAASATAYLLKNGCTPYVFSRSGSRQVNIKPKAQTNGNGQHGNSGKNPAWCPIHQCEMKRWDKDGRVWYSHKVDGQWCSGK
jgi:hypothetical protein